MKCEKISIHMTHFTSQVLVKDGQEVYDFFFLSVFILIIQNLPFQIQVLGGSTGGWESLAYAVFYPEKINYAAVACPDPVSFTQFVTTNIYRDKNMFYYDSPFKRTLKPGMSLIRITRKALENQHSNEHSIVT